MATMTGVVLPGDSSVRYIEKDVPEPGHGQVLLQMPEAYQNVIAGHEPCGQVVAAGPGCKRLTAEGRVVVSCGFGTAYERLLRLSLSGQDRLLITGRGPVGLAAAMLGRAMGAGPIIATDVSPQRLRMATDLGLVDHAVPADEQAGEAYRIADAGAGGKVCIVFE